MNTFEKDTEYIAGTYKRFPIEIVSGHGSRVKAVDGKEYIDMGSGIAVTSFGIADDIWKKAVMDQLDKVQHMSNLYYTTPCADLAEMLCASTGMKKVFFSNSGAEANECAIKVARKYSADKKGPDCHVIVTLKNSFHGRTLTTLSATGQDHYHELYNPLTPGFVSIDAGDLEEAEELAKSGKIAGFLIECVQGEGGVIAMDPDFVKGLSALTDQYDIPLMVDEVQTGNGRSGALYAYMNFGIHPDIVSTAKGLAGGLPLGATLLSEKVQNVLSFGDHGSTFGGNPVCCAAAISIFSRLTPDFLTEVRKKSQFIFDTLKDAQGVVSVSGMGLMIGLKTVKPASEVIDTCMKNGVLCLSAKDKVRLLPALNISMSELKEALDIIVDACKLNT